MREKRADFSLVGIPNDDYKSVALEMMRQVLILLHESEAVMTSPEVSEKECADGRVHLDLKGTYRCADETYELSTYLYFAKLRGEGPWKACRYEIDDPWYQVFVNGDLRCMARYDYEPGSDVEKMTVTLK